ncbi:MAG TPA: hypothetical protein VFF73_40300 [Planctomycetota bacterium]|nr:hypothetical protein [Planctomycetota bacterium]
MEATKRWIALGNKVWFPAGHSSDPRDNLGFWSSFELEGDRVVGLLDVQDENAASQIGKTIQDVSAAIWWDARASSGEAFEAVLEHVCGTPCPVIPGQTNFVRLAREIQVSEQKTVTKLAGGEGLDLASAAKLLLGLPQETDDASVIEALRSRFMGDKDKAEAPEKTVADTGGDGDDDEDGSEIEEGNLAAQGTPIDAAGLATLERQVEELKKENQRIRSRAAKERVDLARQRSVELGVPLEEDVRKEAFALLERGDEEGERLGNRLLDLALRPLAPVGKALPNPGSREDEKAELARDAALERAYLSQGLVVEKDQKGRITRVYRPGPVKK